MVAFWKECKMTKQTFDDLINQINTVSNDVQRERGTLFEKLTLAYLKNEQSVDAFLHAVNHPEIKYGCIQSLDQLDGMAAEKIVHVMNDKFKGFLPNSIQ